MSVTNMLISSASAPTICASSDALVGIGFDMIDRDRPRSTAILMAIKMSGYTWVSGQNGTVSGLCSPLTRAPWLC